MRLGSKRGAALAYVIVITAALLILAAALISAAKFNVDFHKIVWKAAKPTSMPNPPLSTDGRTCT